MLNRFFSGTVDIVANSDFDFCYSEAGPSCICKHFTFYCHSIRFKAEDVYYGGCKSAKTTLCVGDLDA